MVQGLAFESKVTLRFGDEYPKIVEASAKADEWAAHFKRIDEEREANARSETLERVASIRKDAPEPAVVEEDSEMRDATGEEVEMEDVSALPKIIVKGKQREVPTVEVPKKKKKVSVIASDTRLRANRSVDSGCGRERRALRSVREGRTCVFRAAEAFMQ